MTTDSKTKTDYRMPTASKWRANCQGQGLANFSYLPVNGFTRPLESVRAQGLEDLLNGKSSHEEAAKCGTDGKTMWYFCGKCESKDYPLPRDFRVPVFALSSFAPDHHSRPEAEGSEPTE